MEQMTCPKCGKSVSKDDDYCCPHCAELLMGDIESTDKYKAPHPGYGLLVVSLVFAGIAALFFRLSFSSGRLLKGSLLTIIIAAIAAAIAIVCLGVFISMIRDYRLAIKDNAAFQIRMGEREKREQALRDDLEKQRAERAREEAEKRAKLPACPICGKKDNVRRISTLNRSASVAAWGIASAKIGKQYECTNCKHFF